MALTVMQTAFALEYIKSPDNAYQAALRAGYKESSAKDASKWINPDILKNPNEKERKKFKPDLHAFIKEEMDKKNKELIADGDEVLKYLTSVLRGLSSSHVLARNDIGAENIISKPPDEKERLKAAELLGKAHMIFSDKMKVNVALPVVISGGDDLED